MPYTKEEKKERQLQAQQRWREKNKEKMKEYREKYKKKIKEYTEKNKEKKKEYMKEYLQTPQGKKRSRINRWKQQGIVPPCSWDEFHDEWEKTTKCEDCDVLMTEDRYNTSTRKCVDHNHNINNGSPNFRGFVCSGCNIRRG